MRVDLDALLQQVGSKYAMVILAARRARQLVNGGQALVERQLSKPVSIALEELRAGKLEYKMPEDA